MLEHLPLYILGFYGIASIYSSVGFGGGSSYLALLALSYLGPEELRLYALLCNILVVSINLSSKLYRKTVIPWAAALQLCVFSIPFAFLGGLTRLDNKAYFIILGFSLFIASLLLIFQPRNQTMKKPKPVFNFMTSASVGYLSGLVGIGGGIFLAPILYLSSWDKSKNIASVSSIFILLNSIAGLFGLFNQSEASTIDLNSKTLMYLLFAVLLGSLTGNYFSHFKLSQKRIKQLTGILILLVSIKIFLKNI